MFTPRKVYRYILILMIVGLAASLYIVRYAANWLTASSGELTTLRTEVVQLENKRALLDRGKKIISEQHDNIDMLSMVLPAEKDQARVVQEINSIADQSNVVIESIGFPSSTLGSETKPVAAAPATSTEQSGQSQQTAKPPAPATATVSQATPVKEIPGLQSIELSLGTIRSKDSVVVGVRYNEMVQLLRLIERNRRTMQIRSIGITENPSPDSYTLTLSITIFIKP